MSFTEEPTRIWRGWKRRQPRDGVLLAAAGLCGCPPAIQHGGQGWRAEYSRPSALLDTGQTLLEEAALRYSVPLVSMRGLCALPMEFGEALMAA